jgi:hypothetical protein
MADPRPAYAAADLMLGMGGSAARALAFARPLIVQGEAGWSALFEPASAQVLARSSFWSPAAVPDAAARLVATIAPLLEDPERCRDLGRFGRDFAEQNFSLEAMADRLSQFYRTVRGEYTRRDWLADLPVEGRTLSAKVSRLTRHALRLRPTVEEGV